MLQVFQGKITDVHTTQKHELGKMIEEQGKVYVYSKGVANGAAGKWVTVNSLGVTALLAADAVGRVGIMMSALSSATTTFGWVQIYGRNDIASTDTVAAGAGLYIDGTAGRADDASVAGDAILGAWTISADTSNVASVFLNYPFVLNGSYLV